MPSQDNAVTVAYGRVSSKGQNDVASKESQVDEIEEYLSGRGYPPPRLFHDTASGLNTKKRPQFLEMVEYALDKKNQVTDVVFFDLARFTRSNRDFHIYTEQLEEAGITLHSAVIRQEYGNASRLSWKIAAIINEDHSRTTAYNTVRGQKAAVLKGYYIGQTPYGYEKYYITVDEHQHAKLRRHPEQGPHAETMWEMALNRHSPLEIAKHNNSLGIPGPRGKGWTDGTVRYFLRNLTNLGWTYRGRYPTSRLPGRLENREFVYREGAHHAFVDKEDFDKVGEMIKSRDKTRGSTRAKSSPHLFSDIAKCGVCGSNMTVSQRDKSDVDGPRYLRCAKKKKKGADTCTGKGIRMDTLQDLVMGRLMDHYITSEGLDNLIKDVAQNSEKFLPGRR